MPRKRKEVDHGTIQTVDPEMMADIITWCVKENLPHMKVGRPGVGKSDMDAQAVNRLKIDSIVCHPVVHDPTNYSGLPWVVDEITKDGSTRKVANFLPIGFLREMIEAKKTLYVRMEDFGQALPAVQASCMQLFLERKLDEKQISPHVVFGVNTNRREDKAAVSGILETIKSRMLGGIYHVEPTVEAWAKWANAHGMPPWLVAFIRWKPDFLTEWEATQDLLNTPCPRTIAGCGDAVNRGLPEKLWFTVFGGIAGQGFSGELMGFYKIYANLPDPKKIIENPEKSKIPDDAAVQFALCAALANYSNEKNFAKVMKYYERWYDGKEFPNGVPHSEFVLAYVKDAVSRHEELRTHKAYVNWSMEHAADYV